MHSHCTATAQPTAQPLHNPCTPSALTPPSSSTRPACFFPRGANSNSAISGAHDDQPPLVSPTYILEVQQTNLMDTGQVRDAGHSLALAPSRFQHPLTPTG